MPRRSFLDYKLRDVLPTLGLVVLTLNIVGYLGGFLLVDLNVRYGQVKREGKRFLDPQGEIRENSFVRSTTTDPANRRVIYDFDELQTLPTKLFRPQEPQLIIAQKYGRTTPKSGARSSGRSKMLSSSVVQHFEPCVYKDGRTANDGRWYNFSLPAYRFYAYSAIVDNRSSILSDAVLRIIGLGTKLDDDSEKMNIKLYCLLHYSQNKIVYVALDPTVIKIGQGWVLNNEWVREYIFTCPIPMSKVPLAVTVVGNPGESVNSCMPVEVPVIAEKKEDFALCVQVAFDRIDPYRLIEWLELQWLLGVRRVGVYSLNLDKESLDALSHYTKEGYVELRTTDYIEQGPQQYLLHGSPVINDCLYRNIHRFHYIIVIDFDEVIMPKFHPSLRDLVSFLRLNYSTMAFPPVNYIFYNNYFFLDLPPDTSISPYLTMLRFRKKIPISPFGYSVKSIVDSQACLAMHNHFCWTLTPAYMNRSYPHVVDYNIAVNHHYKKCHLNETECRQLMSHYEQDDVILQFKTELIQRVGDKIFNIKGHNI